MTSVINLIQHYQRNIEKCADDEKRVLHCLDKLHQLGVTVHHLQETGVGRTVNALRKEPGEVGTAARALVAKWKNMVASAEDSSEAEDDPPDNTHSGRDSPDDSDHQNESREEGLSYESDEETGEHYTKSYNQTNGSHDGLTKRYHDNDDDSHRKKRSKYSEDSSDEDVKPNIHEIKIKNEHSDSHEEDDEMENVCTSNSPDQRNYHIKIEPKSDDDRENARSKPSKHSSSERTDWNIHQDDDLKSHNSHSSNSDSRRKSEKDSKKGNEKSKHDAKERRKEKESRHSSDKRSSSDKRNTEVKESSPEKHISSGKHKSSDKGKNTSDKHKSSEKIHSKDKHSSLEKHSSSEKQKSSSHKDKSKEESSSHHRDKSRDRERSSHHKDRTRDNESSSYQKDKSRDRESSSTHKEKHEKRGRGHEHLDEKRQKEERLLKEKSRDRDSSSKSKHSDHSSSHSHKNKKEKSSSSVSKHKSHNDLIKVNEEKKSSEKAGSSTHTKDRASSSRKSSKSNDDVPKKKVKTQIEDEDGDDGIDCQSGASFAEALGMTSPVKSKKKSQTKEHGTVSPSNGPSASTSNGAFPLPTNLLAPSTKLAPLPPLEISALPEISPNYKPRPPPKLLPQASDDDALSYVMSTKNQRTKVFSGNKTYGKVLSLYELCVNVLQEHIDALEYTGGVPYDILKPVIDRSTPEQLFVLEHYNPYLMEDTNHLWQRHCERKFRNKQRQEMETSREMYMRCQEEQEARLKSLTANIKMAQDARNAPTKQTKMAYVDTVVKPPRNIARKQAIHGTARAAVTSPAARVAALAGANVVRAGAVAARPSVSPFTPASSSSALKPKKAPLMQKALQFMRGRKR